MYQIFSQHCGQIPDKEPLRKSRLCLPQLHDGDGMAGGVSAGVTGACTEACYIFTNHGEGSVGGAQKRGRKGRGD